MRIDISAEIERELRRLLPEAIARHQRCPSLLDGTIQVNGGSARLVPPEPRLYRPFGVHPLACDREVGFRLTWDSNAPDIAAIVVSVREVVTESVQMFSVAKVDAGVADFLGFQHEAAYDVTARYVARSGRATVPSDPMRVMMFGLQPTPHGR